jgi:uncharacterized protein (DUF342 family)
VNICGDFSLEIDELAIEARVTITPDEAGIELTPDSVVAFLREKGVREGIDDGAIEKAFRALARKKGERVSFVAAAGIPPRPPEPEVVDFAPLEVPSRLAAAGRSVLSRAPQPELFRERVEKVRTEKKVFRKQAIPFLPPKEEIQVVWEKKTIREKATINPVVKATGYVEAGAVVAKIQGGKPGKEGRSILGRMVPPPRSALREVLLGEGITRAHDEVKALSSGFLRRGDLWCDIVPFRDHRIELSASADSLSCILSLQPGDPGAPAPDPTEILARAEKLGFDRQSLLTTDELAALLRNSLARKAALAGVPITPKVDGMAAVAVSTDALRAALTIRKGRGGGKALALAEVSEAIRASGVRGYKAEAVKKDILSFSGGTQVALEDYSLVTGRAAEKGADGAFAWLLPFLQAEEAEGIRQRAAANISRLSGLKSLSVFPLSAVEAVGRVTPGTTVLKISAARDGKPGVDVFGRTLPAERGREPEVRLFEGLKREGEAVVATAGGILEKGSEGMAVRLRVRPHRDAAVAVSVAGDRMSAALSFTPFEGTGAGLGPDEVKAAIEKAGVVQGIDDARLLAALDSVRKNLPLANHLVAEGRRPGADRKERLVVHVRMATGKSVAVREDGRADFRTQDKITHATKGELLATLLPAGGAQQDGWDVTGNAIPAPPEVEQPLAAGANVKAVEELDGSVRFFAEIDGELAISGGLVEVRQVHEIDGDVGLTTGNVKFPGTVHVSGSVLSGFSVIADGDVGVAEVVQAAFLSAGGSVEIGRGIKGEGKAIVRARKDISTSFAEQAALLALGDVRVRGACLRCRLVCNGRLELTSEKGSVMGGTVRARQGIVAQNLGSPGGARTEVSFGQDYVLMEKIEREQREIAKLKKRAGELDIAMKSLARAGPAAAAALVAARAEKLAAMKAIEQRGLLLIGMRDRFDEHVPSEVVVRGTLYPGVVVESHGRRYSVQTEKSNIRLFFSQVEGKILEKI